MKLKRKRTGSKGTDVTVAVAVARRSRQRRLWAPLAGILAMVLVMGLLNGELLLAQVKYHLAKPASAAATSTSAASGTDTSASVQPDSKSPHPELGPRLTIPAISVDAPVVFGAGTAEWQVQLGLRNGVVHYDSTTNPGDAGNVVLFGHSSGQPWAPGDYKFVFTLLDKLKQGDAIVVDYGDTRYTYNVTGSQVVDPTDVSVLNAGTGHELTLITCTPVGTSKNRLVVHAEQISPKPAAAATDAAKTPGTHLQTLPGSAR